MSTEIDSLSVRIEADAKGASEALSSLASSLEKLSKTTGSVTKLTSGLKSIQEAVSKLKTTDCKRLTQLTAALEKLSGAKAPSMTGFAKGMKELAEIAPEGLERVRKTLDSLNGVSIKLPSASGFVKSMEKLSSLDLETAEQNIKGIATAVQELNRSTQDGSLRQFISDLAKVATHASQAAAAVKQAAAGAARTGAPDPSAAAGQLDAKGQKLAAKGQKPAGKQGLFQVNAQSAIRAIDRILSELERLGQTARSTWSSSATYAGAFQNVLSGIGAELKGVVSGVAGLGEFISGTLAGNPALAADGLKRSFQGLQDILTGSLQQAVALARAMATLIGSVSAAPFHIAANAAASFAQSLRAAAQSAADRALRSLPQTIASVAHPLQTARKALDGVRGILSSLTGEVKRSVTVSQNFASSLLKSFTRLLRYRVLNAVIRAAVDAVETGVLNLYYANTKFAASMDLLATDALYLKNSLAAALSPAINALAPIIDAVVDKFVDFINVINMLVAALTGADTWTRAVKVPATYADALDDVTGAASGATAAVEEYKRTILGFDEINKLNDITSSGGSSGSAASGAVDYASMFTTEQVNLNGTGWAQNVADFISQIKESFASGDWAGIGLTVADGLNRIVAAVDGWINGTLRPAGVKWAGNVAEVLNALVSGFGWAALGQTVADGLNAAADIAKKFLTGFQFHSLGSALADGLNGLLDGWDASLLGEAVAGYLNAGISTSYGFIATLNWGELGTKVGDAIAFTVSNLNLGTAANALGRALSGIVEAGINAMEEIDFSALGTRLGLSLEAFLDGYAESGYSIGDALTTAFNHAVLAVDSFLNTGALTHIGTAIGKDIQKFLSGLTWEDAAAALGKALNQLCETAVNLIGEIHWDELGRNIANSLKAFLKTDFLGNVGSVLAKTLNAAITALSNFTSAFTADDWKELGEQIGKSITEFFDTADLEELGLALNSLAEGLLTAAQEALDDVDWDSIMWQISDFLNALNWSAIKTDFIDVAIDAIGDAGVRALFLLGSQLGQSLINGIVSLPGQMLTIGVDIVGGLLNGIAGAVYGIGVWLWDNLASPIIDAVKNLFGIHSPSTVFAEIGGYLTEGLLNGIVAPFADIGTWVDEHIFTPFRNAFDRDGGVSIPVELGSTATQLWNSLKNAWNSGTTKAVSIANSLANTASTLWTKFKESWGSRAVSITNSLANTAGSLWTAFKKGWGTRAISITNTLKNTASSLWENFKKSWSTKSLGLKVTWVTTGLSALQSAVSATLFGGKGWPKLAFAARGGIVDKATLFGNLVAGEDGKEAIIPLENHTEWIDKVAERIGQRVSGNSASSQPVTINVTVTLDGKVVGKSVVNYVNGEARRTGVHPLAAYI